MGQGKGKGPPDPPGSTVTGSLSAAGCQAGCGVEVCARAPAPPHTPPCSPSSLQKLFFFQHVGTGVVGSLLLQHSPRFSLQSPRELEHVPWGLSIPLGQDSSAPAPLLGLLPPGVSSTRDGRDGGSLPIRVKVRPVPWVQEVGFPRLLVREKEMEGQEATLQGSLFFRQSSAW